MDTVADELKSKFCICCLSRQSPLVNLDTCKHASFLSTLFENKVNFSGMCVCNLCHCTIKKVDSFKHQVEESWAELNGVSATMVERSNNLAITNTEVSSLVEGYTSQLQISEDNVYTVEQDHSYFESLELTQVAPLVNDVSADTPLSLDPENAEKKPLAGIPTPLVKGTACLPINILNSIDSKKFQISPVMPLGDGVGVENKDLCKPTFLLIKKLSTPVKARKERVHVDSASNLSLLNILKKRGTEVKRTSNLSVPRKRVRHGETGEQNTTTGKRTKMANGGTGKKYRKPIDQKFVGKIKITVLDFDEMMQERLLEAAKSSYQNLPFKCESCIVGFDHEMTLLEHNKQKHTEVEGSFVCDICKSVLSTERSYKEHRARHLRRYECEVCGRRNNNIHPVVKHYNEQHGTINTQFECQECDFVTNLHSRFRYHREKHKERVKCDLCSGSFVNAARLRVHMLSVHGLSDREFFCHICDKQYRAKSSLVAHIARHYSKPSEATFCAPCGTFFRSVLGLKHHLKTHSRHVRESDMRFVCNECGRKYTSKRALDEHVDWMHLKKVKYECPTCSKGFKNNSALVKHVTFVHEKKRPPRNKICDHCGQGFTSLAILRGHVRTHTGERPLICPHCPATFAHSAALYTHKKLLHSEGKAKAKDK